MNRILSFVHRATDPEVISTLLACFIFIYLASGSPDMVKAMSAEADAKAAAACAKVTDATWPLEGNGNATSNEVCQSRIRDYVYDSVNQDEGLRPCTFAGLAKFCGRSEDRLFVYEIYGDHHLFVQIVGSEELQRVTPHVTWLADPP